MFLFVTNIFFQANSTDTGGVPHSLVYQGGNSLSNVSRKHCLIIYYFIIVFLHQTFIHFQNWKKQFLIPHSMRGSRKFSQRGSKFDKVDEGIEDPYTAINGLSSAHH